MASRRDMYMSGNDVGAGTCTVHTYCTVIA